MAGEDAKKAKARASVERAQKRFEQTTGDARAERHQAFVKAQEDGLTLREIAESTGLHHSGVARIIHE